MSIEIAEIAELMNMSIQAAWNIVGNKRIWKLENAGYTKTGGPRKRYWNRNDAIKEIERINKSRIQHQWRKAIAYNGYELMGEPVTKFPKNKQIREYFKC